LIETLEKLTRSIFQMEHPSKNLSLQYFFEEISLYNMRNVSLSPGVSFVSFLLWPMLFLFIATSAFASSLFLLPFWNFHYFIIILFISFFLSKFPFLSSLVLLFLRFECRGAKTFDKKWWGLEAHLANPSILVILIARLYVS
jgi:hypothetical protein